MIKAIRCRAFRLTGINWYGHGTNRLTVRDRRGHVTTHVYDARNRLKRTTAPAPLNYVQTFEYDAADNLTAETDRRGTRSVHSYDKENRRLSTTKAGVLLESNQYDPVGNLDIHRDANNNRTSYIYNERNLLLTESRSLAAITQYRTTPDNRGQTPFFRHFSVGSFLCFCRISDLA